MNKSEMDLLRRQVEELKAENFMLKQKMMASSLDDASACESEELLNATQRLSKVGGWEWNIEKQTMFWTEEAYRIHDFVIGELLSGSPEHIEKSLACYEPADRFLIHNAFLRCVERGEPYDFELPFTTAAGRKLWVRTTAQPVLDNDRIVSVVGNIMDITDRKRAQEQLAESERKLSTLMDNLPGMAYRCLNDESWTMKFVSDGCFELTGLQADHLIDNQRTSYVDLIHPDDRVMVQETIQKRLAKREQFNLTYRIFDAAGIERWVLHKGQGVFTDTGELAAIEGFITDITERKRSEEALRLSEEKFRLAFKTSPDAINLNRLSDGMYIDINEGFTKLTGFTWADVSGKTSVELSIWVDAGDGYRLVQSLQKDGYVENFEARFRRKDGQIGTGLMSARILGLHQEDLILSITRDITERKQVENALRESEKRYHQILEASPDAILVRSGETIAYANPAALKLLRAEKVQDLIGKRYLDLVHPEDRTVSAERVKKSMNGDWIVPPREHRMMTMDGQVVNVESTGVPIRYQGRIQHFGMFRDITDRKKAEEALQASEEIFNAFMEYCPVYVFFKDENIRSIRLSRNYEQMLGRPFEEILAKSMNELFPEELAKDMIADDRSVISGGKPIKVVENFNGRTYETTKFPILQPGRPSMLAGFTIDITDRMESDKQREKLESQLRQAQKMEAIGTLAGGIAHDFNNILSVIIGNAEILELGDLSFNGKSEVAQILSASKRARQLVRQILAFSRQAQQQKMLMNLKPVVKETIDFLRASIPSTIKLEFYIKPDVEAVMADPTQMQQVLMNLCTNAAHAMEKNGGILTIELDTAIIAEEEVRIDPELEPGEYVRLAVSDTGHGIEPMLLQRIFDPYFTTKEPGKGTGLGLSVVHGIVKSMGGGIKVHSEVGKGTVFQILIPKAEGAVEKDVGLVKKMPFGTESILIVDDEMHLLETYQRMLGMLGYKAECRTSPVEALEAIRANPKKYDLVITDMTMPQMTGYVLAKRLMEIRGDLPVILCTGFSDQITEEKARSVGIYSFLLKPVLFHDLATTLRKVLDESRKSSFR